MLIIRKITILYHLIDLNFHKIVYYIDMINIIYLNGKKTQVDLEKSNLLIDIVEKFSRKIKNQNIAVAVNMKIVTRSEWKSFKVEKNDKIDIVSPFPGG